MAKLWWIIQKDLLCECRARLVWPSMLLLGLVLVYLLSYQMRHLHDNLPEVASSLCWFTICFAAVLTFGQAVNMERDAGCWDGLLLYPVAPQTVFLAKFSVNVATLGALQCVVIPLLSLLFDFPLLAHPWMTILIALLGNLGISAVGTLVGAISSGTQRGLSFLATLLLPLLFPIIVTASEATRLVSVNHLQAELWRCIYFLVAVDTIYITAGVTLFEFAIEE